MSYCCLCLTTLGEFIIFTTDLQLSRMEKINAAHRKHVLGTRTLAMEGSEGDPRAPLWLGSIAGHGLSGQEARLLLGARREDEGRVPSLHGPDDRSPRGEDPDRQERGRLLAHAHHPYQGLPCVQREVLRRRVHRSPTDARGRGACSLLSREHAGALRGGLRASDEGFLANGFPGVPGARRAMWKLRLIVLKGIIGRPRFTSGASLSTTMKIRKATTKDARSLISLKRILDKESPYFLYSTGERPLDLKREETLIKKKNIHKLILEDEGELVGFIEAFQGHTSKTKHTATLVMGILESHQGKGLGQALMERIEELLGDLGIMVIGLEVREDNKKAIILYKKRGYVSSGKKNNFIVENGIYYNLLWMEKYLKT